MPTGYLVNLGADQTLTLDDTVSGAAVAFTTDTYIGAGEWAWTGTYAGTQYYNELEPGGYYLATDGDVYFVPDYGPVSTLTAAAPVAPPTYSELNIVDGTSGADNIGDPYVDADGDGIDDTVDKADYVLAGAGNDTVDANAGDDTVLGGSGNDSILGGAGNDSLSGDGQASQTETLHWFAEGTNNTDLSGGFTQNTGDIDVTVSFSDDGNNAPSFLVDTSTQQYTATGEAFSDHSSLYLDGFGDAATSTTTLSFDAATNADVTNEVENVSFRINDIDWSSGNHQDIVTVNAYGALGNAVSVTITPDTGVANPDTVSGNTITAGTQSDAAGDASGSALVEIAGPVHSVEIVYSNGQGGGQALWVTDVQFDTIPNADGDDTIDGGAGDDTILGGDGADLLAGGTGADSVDGGTGDDTIDVGEGDTVSGGAGDDLFRLVSLAEAGTAGITLVGGEGDEGSGDTLDLNGQADRTTLNLTTNTPGELAGTVELIDGSLLTFSNVEHIICFTPGTMIATPNGPRGVETLAPGDLVLTRDNGPQPILWTGSRTVPATEDHAPIEIDPVLFAGAEAPLTVSPQHRLLWEGSHAQLLFGAREVLIAARHLTVSGAAWARPCDSATYIHLLLPRHEVISANGMPAESFFPGDEAFEALSPEDRATLFEAVPALRSHHAGFDATNRPCLRAHESALLVA